MEVLIAICDDEECARKEMRDVAGKILAEDGTEAQFIEFESGEAVRAYVGEPKNPQITLLFLDIEMDGISGIDLMGESLREEKIWRIAFVSSHAESMGLAFSKKTVAFITKPPIDRDVRRAINVVRQELAETCEISLKALDGTLHTFGADDIAFVRADDSYSEIVFTAESGKENFFSAKSLGTLEDELTEFDFVRTHKSYLVNLNNVKDVTDKVYVGESRAEVPLGRTYRDAVRETYFKFCKEKLRRRML